MSYSDIVSLVLTMAASHVAVASLFSFLGSVVGARIARNEQAKLDQQLRRLDSDLGTAAHVRPSHYDPEFGNYRELWKTVFTVGKYGVLSCLHALLVETSYGQAFLKNKPEGFTGPFSPPSAQGATFTKKWV